MDAKFEERIDELGNLIGLGDVSVGFNLTQLHFALNGRMNRTSYDSATNLACAYVWSNLSDLFEHELGEVRTSLADFAIMHFPRPACLRIIRRLSRDPLPEVRTHIRKLARDNALLEVALPDSKTGDWDTSGWFRGNSGRMKNQVSGSLVQEKNGLPAIRSVGELRDLLGIKSAKQLGYFLLATDEKNGPYTKFTIPKRGGGERTICAPGSQLRWVQRQILRQILDNVPVHSAAHGFVTGRSTVTNATIHQGKEIILKFDLKDFFPTIHANRVIGLFAKLGYFTGNGRFHTNDDSENVGATLARLCTYTSDPSRFGFGHAPQGGPTSPAISNIICRGLDARLEGLAKSCEGDYTRYADDLTFSFANTETSVGRFRWWVDQICHQEGFIVNQAKFRAIRRSQRQSITGIVVNDGLRIPRPQPRRFRAMLHNCRKHGIESQADGNPAFASYLRGFASYLFMVHPEEGKQAMAELDEILGVEE